MPEVAREVFGDVAAKAERYAELLAGPGVERGLLGPNEVPRLWERHLLNSAAVATLIPGPCSVVDLGSGAGLPGIVLALLLPGADVTLLEPALRRTIFLEECVAELGLGNARVWRARAEQAAGELTADVVTARAVAPLDRRWQPWRWASSSPVGSCSRSRAPRPKRRSGPHATRCGGWVCKAWRFWPPGAVRSIRLPQSSG